MARVVSVNISEQKGTIKKPIEKGYFRENHGLEGDAHAGNGDRQVSLLAQESIDKMKKMGIWNLDAGKFAENITTEGIELHTLPIGTKLKVGDEVILKISQVGKKCHGVCEIRKITGDCIMPKEGIFARVLKSGYIKPGDEIVVVELPVT